MGKKRDLDLVNAPLRIKASLLSGNGTWETTALPKYGIGRVEMHDGPLGLRKPKGDGIGLNESLPATLFPSPALLACSWDQAVLASVGKAIGNECKANGTNVLLAPGLNIKRNPLCGRNFEYYSEDPLLSGEMGAGFVKGIQSVGVGACIKHFACNNQEKRRMYYSAEVDERALNDIYLKPFQIAIEESNPWMVMASYNRLNGTYCAENPHLLNTILREAWHYEGVSVSDWGAVDDPVAAHAAGLDLEMPVLSKRRTKAIKRGVKNRRISRSRFEEEAKRMKELEKKARAGEKIPVDPSIDSYHVALNAAIQSIVLAKNEKSILPLKSFDDVCIIGALAKNPNLMGGGSSMVNATFTTNFYEMASKEAGTALPYASGYRLDEDSDDEELSFEAMDLASRHKYVIFFAGPSVGEDSEMYDRLDMRLPSNQSKLFESIRSLNKNIILIVNSGSPVELPIAEESKAVIITYFAGAATGEALLRIVLGQDNPSGHLAESWPLRYLDVPSADFYGEDKASSLYKESIFVGYRFYVTSKKRTLFPFGHGLSYSSFEYSNLKISRQKLPAGKTLKVMATVTNVSDVAGAAVIQLYVGANNEKTLHPLRELKGFQKVFLAPHKSAVVSFTLPYEAFAHSQTNRDGLVVDDDIYTIEIGNSAEEIALSVQIPVISPNKPANMRFLTPSYFRMRSAGAFRVSDEEFEILLNHRPWRGRRSKRPYNRNSTFKDIANAFVGKKIVKRLKKEAFDPSLPSDINERRFNALLEMPLRSMLTAGISAKKMNALIALLNHRPLLALLFLLFGHR